MSNSLDGLNFVQGVSRQSHDSIHPAGFRVYRKSNGALRWYQRWFEAWLVFTRQHSLHLAWQRGYDFGVKQEHHRTIIMGGR